MLRAISVTSTRVGSAYTARTSLHPTNRQLHASLVASKTATEKVSEVADKVCARTPFPTKGNVCTNRDGTGLQVYKSVGRGLGSAIETGEQVTEKTKETYGMPARGFPVTHTVILTSRQYLGAAKDSVKSAAKETKEVS